MTTETRRPFGLEVETFAPRSVVGRIETTATGNVAVSVGRQHSAGSGWTKTEHVTLTADEAVDLAEALLRAAKLDAVADAIHEARV